MRELIEQWASAGDPNAMIKLAELCIKEDRLDEAKKLLAQAADKNYRPAAINLARILHDEGNLPEAVTFYKKAVELGDVKAMNVLIDLFPNDNETLDFVLENINKRYDNIYITSAGRFAFGSMRVEEYTPQYGEAVERRRIRNKILQLKAKEA
ncbi:MAG: sel1 repeat family protein [Selenomonadaceae bacterium]|nr:sel1 repeat family protein [Selenomonadaceae bacterium]